MIFLLIFMVSWSFLGFCFFGIYCKPGAPSGKILLYTFLGGPVIWALVCMSINDHEIFKSKQRDD